jgi:Putative Ig domain
VGAGTPDTGSDRTVSDVADVDSDRNIADAGSDQGDSPETQEAAAPIVIDPASLRDVRMSVSLSVDLSATGGIGVPYAFRVESGSLPSGLTLGTDGRLSGVPRESGEFSFVVTATDASGNVGRRAYALRVWVNRWLAYETFQSSSSTRTAVFVVDYTKTDLDPIPLMDDVSEPHYAFSPDGRWLEIITAAGATKANRYFVDISSEKLKDLRLLGTTEYEQYDAWSPDSTKLAYTEQKGDRRELKYVDVSGGTFSAPVTVAEVGSWPVFWPSAGTLVYAGLSGSTQIVRWNGAGFGAPETLDIPIKTLPPISPLGDRALFSGDTNEYWLVDFNTLKFAKLPSASWTISPTFEVALESDLGRTHYSLHRVQGTDIGAAFPLTDAVPYPPYSWARAHPWIGWGTADRVDLAAVDPSAVTVSQVPGDYAPLSYPWSGAFLSDDSQLVIRQGGSLWLSRISAGMPATAVKLTDAPDVADFTVSGNAPLLTTHSDKRADMRIFDERASGSSKPRVVDVGGNSYVQSWSFDSSHIAYFVHGQPWGRALYLLDISDPNSQPRLLASCNMSGGAHPGCPAAAQFQP